MGVRSVSPGAALYARVTRMGLPRTYILSAAARLFLRRAVLEATVTQFGWESLVVMWLAEGDITERKLGQLGFRKIAGEELVFRDLPLRTAYGDQFPLGETIEEVATPEHHTWVIAQTEPLTAQ